MAGGLLLVGSADGSLTLENSKLGASDLSSSHAAVHDMWAGELPCVHAYVCSEKGKTCHVHSYRISAGKHQ